MLDRHPGEDLEALIVWIPMVEGDDLAGARESSAIFAGDARVLQFWDGKRLAGTAFAKRHYPSATGAAWDIYLFYEPEAAWAEPCPVPHEFLKQFDWREEAPGTITSVLTRGKWDARFESDLSREIAEAFDRLSASN